MQDAFWPFTIMWYLNVSKHATGRLGQGYMGRYKNLCRKQAPLGVSNLHWWRVSHAQRGRAWTYFHLCEQDKKMTTALWFVMLHNRPQDIVLFRNSTFPGAEASSENTLYMQFSSVHYQEVEKNKQTKSSVMWWYNIGSNNIFTLSSHYKQDSKNHSHPSSSYILK